MADTRALRTAIAEEAAAMIAFVDVLEQEKQALVAGSVEDVLAVVERKNRLITQLGQAGALRDKAFADLGLPDTSRSIVEDFLQRQDADLRAAWRSLLDIAQRANQANRVNASLVSSRLQQNQQALSVLRSAQGQTEDEATYGPDGQRLQAHSRRPLGSA